MSENTAIAADPKEEPKAPPAATGDGSNVDKKPDAEVVPMKALIAEREKRQKLEGELDVFRKKQQEETDAKTKAAGDITAAQQERDKFKAEADDWRKFATDQLDLVTGTLDESGKKVLEALGEDVPLSKRLRVAQELAGRSTNQSADPGHGIGGGKGKEKPGSLIPSGVHDGQSYHEWIARESQSGNPERMAFLFDDKKMAAIEAEARERKFIR